MKARLPVEGCDCPSCEHRRRLMGWADVGKGVALIVVFVAFVVLMVGGWQ